MQVVKIESRIRNLNWGGITSESRASIEVARYAAGVLNYTFPGGEHTPSYAQAVADFVGELLENSSETRFPECIVVITHGFAFRLVARSILGIPDEKFRLLANPANCFYAEIVPSIGGTGPESFRLLTPLPVIRHMP